jgi:hypothetical protein
MVEHEIDAREALRGETPAPEEILDANDRDEEEYQCEFCKTLCYLSQVVSQGAQHISCLDHFEQLPAGPKTLRLRFPDSELNQLVNRVKNRADKAGRQPDPSTGLLEGMDGPRQSGRKRKPSAALLEAAVDLDIPTAQRARTDGPSQPAFVDGQPQPQEHFSPAPPPLDGVAQQEQAPADAAAAVAPEPQADFSVDLPVGESGDIEIGDGYDVPAAGGTEDGSFHGLYTPQASASPAAGGLPVQNGAPAPAAAVDPYAVPQADGWTGNGAAPGW